MGKNEAVFTKAESGKSLSVVRSFDAPLQDVWNAWSDPAMLDNWWAPKPYRAETKKMDFRTGGQWLYAMVSPEGDRNWCRVDFTEVKPPLTMVSVVMFCDEQGNENTDFPKMEWRANFTGMDDSTTVRIEISYASVADMQKILEMGFQQGFTMALENLDDMLAK